MRSFFTTILLGGLLTVLPLNLFAQQQTEIRVQGYLGGGVTTPLAPNGFTDLNGTGGHLSGGIGITLDSNWSAMLTVDYHALPAEEISTSFPIRDPNDNIIEEGTLIAEGGYTAGMALVNLKYTFVPAQTARPYLVGGIGFYREQVEATGRVESTSQPDEFIDSTRSRSGAALGIGGGVVFALTDTVGFFVEPRYGVVFSNPDPRQHLGLRGGILLNP